MTHKKVLVITYYWPPAGGIAVQRVTKFCKYLSEFGWEPIILTIKDGNFENVDNTLLSDIENVKNVYRSSSIEPHTLYKVIGKLITPKKSRTQKPGTNTPKRTGFATFSEYIRLNVFIPDTRIGWLPSACRRANKIIAKYKPDLIFSTAPPYTPHLIAMKLHKNHSIPWVADFRDPWVESTLYNTVKRLKIVKTINRQLERKVISNASALVFTGPGLRDHYMKDTGIDFSLKANIITNGYDPSDVQIKTTGNPDKFYITYFGSLYFRRFNAHIFQLLARLIKNNRDIADTLCMRFIGNIDIEVQQFIKQLIPENNLVFYDYIPYKEAVKELLAPQLLLLIIDRVPFNDNITLGKVFDYLATGNPILGIGPPNGDTAKIIQSANAGKLFDYDDEFPIENFILEKHKMWKENHLRSEHMDLKIYERKYLTEKLASVFDKITGDI